jgi:hypothetical protein
MHQIVMAGVLVLAHGAHTEHGSVLGGLVHTMMHSFAASIGWMLGRSVFHLLGFGIVAALALVAVIWWQRSRRRTASYRSRQ